MTLRQPCVRSFRRSQKQSKTFLRTLTDDREQTKCTAAGSKCRGERLWHFWRVNKRPRRMPMVQVSFFVGISSIYHCTAFEEAAPLMSIMTTAFIALFCVVKGFEEWIRAQAPTLASAVYSSILMETRRSRKCVLIRAPDRRDVIPRL
jgi:hypothetical protein